MPRYADSDKEKVREAVDLIDLVSTRTELRRAGPGRYMGRCPFHEERSPSFSVDTSKGLYHCFGCGVGGDAYKFVMETEGLDFTGALESLARRVGIELTVEDEDPQAAERRMARERLMELLERAAVFYERYLWDSAEAAPARVYLLERGLTEETLKTFRVGYAPSTWDKLMQLARVGNYTHKEMFDAGLATRGGKSEGRLYDRFRRRIMFPLQDMRGRVLGFGARALGADQQPKYLNSPDGEIFHKGDIVFGAHHARVAAAKADEVIAAEGYMDVLALHQAGMKNVVGVMGTSLTDKQVGELAKLAKTVLLALDADAAGQEAMLRAQRVAASSSLSLRVVPLPKGLDPADVVQQQGADATRALVQRSMPFVKFQVDRELERADLTQAEGKDSAIAALKPVFGTLPPSALREELLARVADVVDLPPSMVSSWLPVAGERLSTGPPSRGAGGGGQGRGGGASRRRVEESPAFRRPVGPSPLARAERDFLAQCIAMPDAAAEILVNLDDAAFSNDPMRRVLAHVREHVHAPQDGIPDDDHMLVGAIAELVHRAADLAPSRAALQGQLANIELLRIDREIEAAKAAGLGGVAGLRARRDILEDRRNTLIAQAMDETAPTG
ncbi:DNA primase [Baekduia sp.]|jgi:DNA primase|uniref:DNA primase n=1 Tax=Baekduia sp. TaxID=2600305 RepID=UPI002E03451D|nr:DNA primase [Baekduia sp.]